VGLAAAACALLGLPAAGSSLAAGAGGGGSPLSGAAGVAVDQSSHDVYVAAGRHLVKLDAAGAVLSTVGSFHDAVAVAVDPGTGDVYVADDSGPGAVERFSATGADLGRVRYSFGGPVSVAVDGSGNLFVLDSSDLWEFDRSGRYVSDFLTSMNNPSWAAGAVAADPRTNDVYVTYDMPAVAPHTVVSVEVDRYTSDGWPMGVVGSEGSGNGQFASGLAGIGVDPATGDLYVGDRANGRVERFDDTGRFRSQFKVRNPLDVAVDSTTHVVYVATGTGVAAYSGTGSLLGQLGGGAIRLPASSTPPTPPPCVVPQVSRLSLAAAQQRLLAADCTVGTLTRVYPHGVDTESVVKSNPGPGRRLPAGARVALTVAW